MQVEVEGEVKGEVKVEVEVEVEVEVKVEVKVEATKLNNRFYFAFPIFFNFMVIHTKS